MDIGAYDIECIAKGPIPSTWNAKKLKVWLLNH